MKRQLHNNQHVAGKGSLIQPQFVLFKVNVNKFASYYLPNLIFILIKLSNFFKPQTSLWEINVKI